MSTPTPIFDRLVAERGGFPGTTPTLPAKPAPRKRATKRPAKATTAKTSRAKPSAPAPT